MKIRIQGFYGRDNLGDDYILMSLLSTLNKIQSVSREKNIECDVVVRDKSYLGYKSIIDNYKYLIRLIDDGNGCNIIKKASILLHNIQGTDYWIIGGGGLFPNENPRYLLKLLIYIKWAKLFGTRVCMYGIDINPVKSDKCINLWRKLIREVDFITTRNENCYLMLEKIEKKNTQHYSDITFSLTTQNEKDDQINLAKKLGLENGMYEAWVVAMPWSKKELASDHVQERYQKLCKLIAGEIDHIKSKVLFIPFFYGNDLQFITDIVERVSDTSRIVVADEKSGIVFSDRRLLFKHAKQCVCMRFHSVLFALYYAKPFLAISYSPKTSQLLREIGLDDRMVELGIRSNEFFYKEFDIEEKLLNRLLLEREKQDKKKLEDISVDMKKQALAEEACLISWLNKEKYIVATK